MSFFRVEASLFRLFRYVWCMCARVEPVEEDMAAASILISVPKKRFKRAVKRNLVKRQVREAYRKNKHLLLDALASRNKRLIIAFIWLDNHIHSSAEAEEKVKKLLFHIVERLE